MLHIEKVKKTNRKNLTWSEKINPLYSVFNVTAKCTQDEIAPYQVTNLSLDVQDVIDKGQIYHLKLIYKFNPESAFLAEGDDISLQDLHNFRKTSYWLIGSDIKTDDLFLTDDYGPVKNWVRPEKYKK